MATTTTRSTVDAGVAGKEEQEMFSKLMAAARGTGGLPTDEEVSQAQRMANRLFQQRLGAMRGGAFQVQEQQMASQAASLGRSIRDPALQSRLRMSQAGQEAAAAGEQQMMAQQLASQSAGQRVQTAQQLYSRLQQERVAGAKRTSISTSTTTPSPFAAMMGMASTGMELYGSFNTPNKANDNQAAGG